MNISYDEATETLTITLCDQDMTPEAPEDLHDVVRDLLHEHDCELVVLDMNEIARITGAGVVELILTVGVCRAHDVEHEVVGCRRELQHDIKHDCLTGFNFK